MSVKCYLQAFDNGHEQLIPRDRILSAFSAYQTKIEYGSIVVTLPEGDVEFYMNVGDEVSRMVYERPIESLALDSLIYEIMRCGSFILFSHNANFPIVLQSNVVDNLPAEMLEKFGRPKVADSLELYYCLSREMFEDSLDSVERSTESFAKSLHRYNRVRILWLTTLVLWVVFCAWLIYEVQNDLSHIGHGLTAFIIVASFFSFLLGVGTFLYPYEFWEFTHGLRWDVEGGEPTSLGIVVYQFSGVVGVIAPFFVLGMILARV